MIGQAGGGVEGHQTEAGQRAGGLVARLLQAVLGGGQMIAVEQTDPVARQPRGQRAEFRDHGREAVGTEADEFGTDVRLDTRQLVVDGGKRDREFLLGSPVSGPNRGANPANGLGEQIEGGGEEQVAGVLLLGTAPEKGIEILRNEDAFESGAGHDGEGTLRDEALK